MKLNVGTVDRSIRIIAGMGLLAWAATGGPVWGWLGLLPLLTGALGFCPAYPLLGINTCRTKSRD
jgi:hypothetical protein